MGDAVEQLISHLTNGLRGWASLYAESGPLFIRAQNINTDELRLDDIAHVAVPESVEAQRTKVLNHDLLITITGANVTKTALVRNDIGDAYVSQHVGLVRPIMTDTSPYIYLWIVSPANGRRVLEKLAYGAGKPERRLSVAQEVEGIVAAGLHRAERLRQSILKQAFAGRLVM